MEPPPIQEPATPEWERLRQAERNWLAMRGPRRYLRRLENLRTQVAKTVGMDPAERERLAAIVRCGDFRWLEYRRAKCRPETQNGCSCVTPSPAETSSAGIDQRTAANAAEVTC